MRVSAAIHTSGTVNINILFFNVKTPGKLLLCIGGGGGGGGAKRQVVVSAVFLTL